MLRLRLIALLALGAAGCATLEEPFRAHRESASPEVRQCADWYSALDREATDAGVRDAQDARIPGFPYLRVNRLLASFRHEAAADERGLRAWADRLLELDVAARRHEIANLPPERFDALPDPAALLSHRVAAQHTQFCGRMLRELDLANPASRAALGERAQVPDDYSMLNRVIGVYALSKIPFTRGVRRYQEEVLAAFRREPAVPEGGTVVRYSPPPVARLSRAMIAGILKRATAEPLGIPEPSGADMDALFALYAPIFEIEITGDFDRFGALRWRLGSDMPGVEPTDLTVYRNAAWTRYRNLTLLQLVYTIWFPERPPDSETDLLAGKLDGLTWRVTLAPDGEPLVFDTMHPCGCYHMFFPTQSAHALAAPDEPPEWMFLPQALPRIAERERVVLRVATRTHYITRVSVEREAESIVRFELRPYDDLRSLGRPEGGLRSAFGPDGLVAGTERAERYLFWPMGIDSAGAMRQWGRHATAFVGRQHFDDADLFEKRFRFELQ
ncbi:MAG: hypothetical protein HYX46_00875 [Betaproteobacteria bacterium]|nr:hypothetical protein [Betaproteobacteria bacterium]